jgi:protein O-mannosyl-transferase
MQSLADNPVLPSHAAAPQTLPGIAQRIVWRRIVLLAILAATFLVYAKSFSYRFVYDDNYQIVNNDHLSSWRSLPVYFTQKFWSQIPDNDSNLYRPFFLVWLRLNMALFGRNPWAWHVMTVIMHVLVTWLVYLLVRRLLRNDSGALLAAAIFGLHPIHVEVAAWISAVNESLGMALLLLAFLCYLKQRSRSAGRVWWLALSVTLFAAAVLVKETECVLPLLIVAYELTLGRDSAAQLQEISRTGWLRCLIPYCAVLGAYFVVRAMVMHVAFHPGEASLTEAILSQPWLLCLYLKMIVWPGSLAIMYDFPYIHDVLSLRFAAGLAIILLFAAIVWKAQKRSSGIVIFAAAWFVLTLAPAMAAFCLAYKSESYHDRYLYLPLFAAALLAGAVFRYLTSQPAQFSRALAYAPAALLLAFMAFATYRQLDYWQNNYVLFQHSTQIAPENERSAADLAAEMIYSGNFPPALQLSERMMKLHPDSVLPVRPAALAAFLLQDFSLAENYYAKAVTLDPSEGQMYFFLGVTRIRLGCYQEAAAALQKAALLSPEIQGLHYNLGFALMKLGHLQEAREEFAAELKSDATNVAARQAMADINKHL